MYTLFDLSSTQGVLIFIYVQSINAYRIYNTKYRTEMLKSILWIQPVQQFKQDSVKPVQLYTLILILLKLKWVLLSMITLIILVQTLFTFKKYKAIRTSTIKIYMVFRIWQILATN